MPSDRKANEGVGTPPRPHAYGNHDSPISLTGRPDQITWLRDAHWRSLLNRRRLCGLDYPLASLAARPPFSHPSYDGDRDARWRSLPNHRRPPRTLAHLFSQLVVGFDLDMTLIDTVLGFAATLDALGTELGVEFPGER